uniref:Uncharacterized protein n=1 Tax=Fagus sylvatica TaxID=28930 RepID=A0A2N9F5D3_FAGSY
MFTAQSRARSMHIHYQLATLRKGDSSVADYYHRFTNLIDTLAAIDQPVPHHEQLSFLLAGLGPEFDSLVTSVKTQFQPDPPIKVDVVVVVHLPVSLRIGADPTGIINEAGGVVVLTSPMLQIVLCVKFATKLVMLPYSVIIRFNNSYTMDNTPQMQALLATQQQVVDPTWYLDSGATHHLTHDLANLNVRADEYSGSE